MVNAKKKLCVIMDPLDQINIKKDTTIALMLEAQKRDWEIYITEPKDLFVSEGQTYGFISKGQLRDSQTDWITLTEPMAKKMLLTDFDFVFMRKDPPFDLNFLHTTYLLDIAQKAGCLILNNPQSLRDANEKLFTTWFPECCPPSLVTARLDLLQSFLAEQKKIIVKPLHNMGGQGIFLLQENDPNIHATIELLTHKGQVLIMAQRFLPEIMQGDKRILIIAGKPYPYALARIPKKGDIRGNLAAGATGVGYSLSPRDRWLCERIGPTLLKKGLFFVGVDVIGDYVTEINVTSPTCVKEITAAFQVNVASDVMDALGQYLTSYRPPTVF